MAKKDTVKTVHLPDWHEDAIYNEKDLCEWQLGRKAVLGQGYRSGSIYLLIFDKDGALVRVDLY